MRWIALFLLLAGGCAEFRDAFSAPAYTKSRIKEKKKAKPYSRRNPMDELILQQRDKKPYFEGVELNAVERREVEKLNQQDDFTRNALDKIHMGDDARKKKNSHWVFGTKLYE